MTVGEILIGIMEVREADRKGPMNATVVGDEIVGGEIEIEIVNDAGVLITRGREAVGAGARMIVSAACLLYGQSFVFHLIYAHTDTLTCTYTLTVWNDLILYNVMLNTLLRASRVCAWFKSFQTCCGRRSTGKKCLIIIDFIVVIE